MLSPRIRAAIRVPIPLEPANPPRTLTMKAKTGTKEENRKKK